MKITVLTPTCDRPIGIALLERMMARQTRKPDQWIIGDGGEVPAPLTMGQIHLHDQRPPGAANFAHNLLNGLNAAAGDLVIIAEDDDFYLPTHVETMAAMAERYRLIGSEPVQRYYNVAHRCYRLFNNIGASLCQTAVRRELFPAFRQAIQAPLGRNGFGVDAALWRGQPVTEWAFTRQMTVVGIKGLPGSIGLGVGHRPDARWSPDPELAKLRAWIGDDAESYAGFRVSKAA